MQEKFILMLLNSCGGILPNDKQYARYAKLVEEIEEKCLKKSRHVPPKDAIYETPSDYDPLALNMGQLVVHRISLRFCDEVISSLSLLSSSLFLVVIVILTTKFSRSLEQVQVRSKPTPVRRALWKSSAIQTSGRRIYGISCEFVMTFCHFKT